MVSATCGKVETTFLSEEAIRNGPASVVTTVGPDSGTPVESDPTTHLRPMPSPRR